MNVEFDENMIVVNADSWHEYEILNEWYDKNEGQALWKSVAVRIVIR